MRGYRVLVVATMVLSISLTMVPAVGAAGAVWVPSFSNPPQGWTTVDLFADGTGYVHRTDQSGTTFWKTADGGVTYQPATVPPGDLLDFATADIGYSALFDGLWRSADGAASWAESSLPRPNEGRQDEITALHATDGGETVALGVTTEATSDECGYSPFTRRVEAAVSRDAGASWERVQLLDEPGKAQMIEMLSADYGVALVSKVDWVEDGPCSFTGNGTLGQLVYVIERDPGSGVLESTQVLDCRPRICGSVGVAARDVFTVGFVDGGIAHTTDNGATFTTSELADAVADAASDNVLHNAFWVTEIEFANDKVGYAVTNGRGMWRTDDGGATWSSEPSGRVVYDLGIADLGVAGPDHALAGGPALVVRRQTTPAP